MSLETDSIFIAAATANADIVRKTGGRIYSTAIPAPDEEAENVPVPYIIVALDGVENDNFSKDDDWESETDRVQVSVEVTARSREELAELTKELRLCFREYIAEHDTGVEEYQFAADAVQYDAGKPCFWQVLRYQCETSNN